MEIGYRDCGFPGFPQFRNFRDNISNLATTLDILNNLLHTNDLSFDAIEYELLTLFTYTVNKIAI
jgi:hypothetical protein